MRVWSDSDDEIIRAAYKRGTEVKLIADQLGVTRKAVIGRAFRIGAKHKYPHGWRSPYHSAKAVARHAANRQAVA